MNTYFNSLRIETVIFIVIAIWHLIQEYETEEKLNLLKFEESSVTRTFCFR